MKPFKNYIATWFYRESHEEASYYPQAGGRGDSALLHSVYMQIQVPFFTTFRHYNPEAELLFFTNLEAGQLPAISYGTVPKDKNGSRHSPLPEPSPKRMVQSLDEPILCIRHLQGNGETHATWRHVVGL